MGNIQLLDCTLRDGGYINEWEFGNRVICDICDQLIAANIDIIEIGFLKDCDYNENKTLYNNINEIKQTISKKKGNAKFFAMALHNKYNIENLEVNKDNFIDGIRVTFHNYDIEQGLKYCSKIMEKGYECYCQPINIMGYSDAQILELLNAVNLIQPTGFAIVDTFGSMTRNDLFRIVSLVNHNLEKNIKLGIHLHENLGLSYALAQEFINLCTSDRDIIIDASLSGMGRVPGNLCIELMAEYLNNCYKKNYSVDYILDAIDDYILNIKSKVTWGYSAPYFLSAKYNLHRNYAEDLVNRGNLKAKDINHILGMIIEEKKAAFDKNYIDQLYYSYQNNIVDDSSDYKKLKEIFYDTNILILAPGKTIINEEKKIKDFIKKKNPIVICVNFSSENIPHQMLFFSNSKRLKQSKIKKELIITSNLLKESNNFDYVLNYNKLVDTNLFGDNSVIMLLHFLKEIKIKKVFLAGFDGYVINGENYYDNFFSYIGKSISEQNLLIKKSIEQIKHDIDITFITESLYEVYS